MNPRPGGARWRIVTHALDRTGPPMLALSALRWLHNKHPEIALSAMAFRGGDLEPEIRSVADLEVVLDADPEEAWDHADPDRRRMAALRERFADTPPAAVNLLVSVAAGQVLPLLPDSIGPIVTWSVEVGEDLHWMDAPIGLRSRTDTWLAGSHATAAELADRLCGTPPKVVPELIEDPSPLPTGMVEEIRAQVGAEPGERMVLGAGIGTHRKGLDLFVEVALAHRRAGFDPARFVWIGGVRDELYPWVKADLRRLDIGHVELLAPVPDIDSWCAAADVFLHTARLDAFPLVCLHAAAAGTPVVAFLDKSGVREMFGGDALGAPYPDVRGLAAAVSALADLEAAAAAGVRQRDHVLRRHVASVALPVLHAELAAIAESRGGKQR